MARTIQAPIVRSERRNPVARGACTRVHSPDTPKHKPIDAMSETRCYRSRARQRPRAGVERKLARRSRRGFRRLMQLEGFTCPDEVRQGSHGHLPHNMTSMNLDGDFTCSEFSRRLFVHEPGRHKRHDFARGVSDRSACLVRQAPCRYPVAFGPVQSPARRHRACPDRGTSSGNRRLLSSP